MGKKNKNRGPKPQGQSRVSNNANNPTQARPDASAAEQKPITVEDIKASVTQAEFEEKKKILFEQLEKEAGEWESLRESAEKNAELVQSKLEQLEQKKVDLEKEKEQLEKDVQVYNQIISSTEKDAQKIIDKANDIRDQAEKYADDKRKEADKESIRIIQKASAEARAAWQNQVDELNEQIKDIAERESELQKAQRDVERAKRFVEDEKEVIEELKEDLQRRKSRYEGASPAKVTQLETELTDERSKYTALQERYHVLSKRLEEMQVLMDTVKTEIEDPETGRRITSVNEIVSTLQDLREEHTKLASIYSKYPDDAAISALEEKAQRSEQLEHENSALAMERDRYREEVVAAKNTLRELETVKQEVEATNALNDHLLKELESHKSALESRTGDTCPSLSKVDSEVEEADFKADIVAKTQRQELSSLSEIVSHVKNFAGCGANGEYLYYTENDIRAFLSGMAVSRLIILQGMSGTGKSSLPRIFSEAISGFNKLIPVESSWRDRNELLGYYNDFNKKFNAKSFTIELYRSSKKACQEIPTFIVLDEMNLARIEYYFSDFLAILQEPDHEKWLIELVSSDMRTLPMELPEAVKAKMKRDEPTLFSIWEKIERVRQGDLKAETSDEEKEELTSYLGKLKQLTGAKSLIDGRKIKVTDNIWFIGTANRDESTFEISDKVYDRAQVVSLNRKGVSEKKYLQTKAKYISVSALEDLFDYAIKNNKKRSAVEERLEQLDKVLIEQFDVSFGNRIVTQTIDFTAVFVAAGGKLEDALDYQISTKILRKVITSDDADALLALEEAVHDYPETTRLIEKRLKELK